MNIFRSLFSVAMCSLLMSFSVHAVKNNEVSAKSRRNCWNYEERIKGDYDYSDTYSQLAQEVADGREIMTPAEEVAVFNGMGKLCLDAEQYDEALKHLNEALIAWYGIIDGQSSTSQWVSIHIHFALLYQKCNKWKKAESYFLSALQKQVSVYGLNHKITARLLAHLGALNSKFGRYEEALAFFNRALAFQKNHFTDIHPETANTLHNLGYCYHELGDLKNAQIFLKRALLAKQELSSKVGSRLYAPNHVDLKPTILALSVANVHLRKWEEAGHYLRMFNSQLKKEGSMPTDQSCQLAQIIAKKGTFIRKTRISKKYSDAVGLFSLDEVIVWF